MGRRLKRQCSKVQEESKKTSVEVKKADMKKNSRRNKTVAVKRNKGVSDSAKSRDILKDVNKLSGSEDAVSTSQGNDKLNQAQKRKKTFEEGQVRKVAKKDIEPTSSKLTEATKNEKKLTSNVKPETSQEVSHSPKKLGKDNKPLNKTNKVTTSQKPKLPKPSTASSPGKPNINKLKQKVKEHTIKVKDKGINPEKQKSTVKRKPALSIEKATPKNKDRCEEKKEKKLTGKSKSPVKGSTSKGESSVYSSQKKILDSEISDDERDDSEMEWEDVDEAELGALDEEGETSSLRDSRSLSSSSNVEVTIQVPGKKKKSGKCTQEQIHSWIQRKINRLKKEAQIRAHKVHLMTLLANGLRKNDLCSNPIPQAIGLSLVPDQFTRRGVIKTWDISFLTRVATWFKNKAPAPAEIHTGHSEATYLMRVLEKKIYLFIVILRALGLFVRLVMSLQALDIKVSVVNGSKNPGPSKTPKNPKVKQNTEKQGKQKQSLKKQPKNNSKESLLNKLKRKPTPSKVGGSSSGKTFRKKPRIDYSMNSDRTESEYFQHEKKTSSGDSSSAILSNNSDDEEDFEISPKTPKRRRTISKDLDSRCMELEEGLKGVGENSSVLKKGVNVWVEVYLEKEKKWICIDGESFSVNRPEECEKHATKPIKYIVAFDNENSIKDVTSRYVSDWLTTTPKLRVEPEWWDETLSFYRTKDLKKQKKEDSLLKSQLLRKPLPTSVTEYKNHPLYALERHLLKFEAIYPESAATLGFCRGEPVYSRDCVHTLHTRATWMKQARVVKSGEKAYKIVKGRKTRRKVMETLGEITADLFGEWQTEDYVPPPVIDGKVPRNEYGNVELFKPSMLPLGACHIQIPGIHRLARKLNIDAVPAIVGFDTHGGFTHPIIDGVVVCKENKDVLLDAWEKEQELRIIREQEKREKRALGNWRHLVRSLRIRERLKRKYNMEDEQEVKEKVEKKDNSNETDATDLSLSWPLNKQEGKTTRADDGHCHVFLEANHSQDPVTGEWSKICSCGLKEPL